MEDETLNSIIDVIKPAAPKRRRFWLVFLVLALLITGAFFVVLYGYGVKYSERVLPGISIGSVPVGGLTRAEVKNHIDIMVDKLVSDGLEFKYQVDGGEKTLMVYPVVAVDGNPVELVRVDSEAAADYLVNLGKFHLPIIDGWQAMQSRWFTVDVAIPFVVVDSQRLLSVVAGELAPHETIPHNASIKIKSTKPIDYEIIKSNVGVVYDLSGVVDEIKKSWAKLEGVNLQVKLREKQPTINEADVEKVAARLDKIFVGKIEMSYEDPQTLQQRAWLINEAKIKDWLEVQKTDKDEIVFGLKQEKVESYLNDIISPEVNIEPVNAKFKMNNGKVTEFQGSRPGMKLAVDATYQALNEIIWSRTWHDEGVPQSVALRVEKAEPDIKTGDVNDLGIAEVLGVGISDYSNSPTNRIKNIANAVRKLNGILIQPGDIFSTLKYTAPFTLEGGYLPELVIKGDEIKPEIGGGLCQIGTTLFRTAMNSGMKIVERRNHALIVNHYDDPINGNPGTDATIYDPSPDFKFLNDTGNAILLQTYMDTKHQELVFTLWGTSDGRKASYTHPVVLKWYPYGEPKIVETDKLESGKEKCQNPFRGADASFVYTRVMADGKEEKITYASHYRPLPKICMKGIDPNVVASSTLPVDVLLLVEEVAATE